MKRYVIGLLCMVALAMFGRPALADGGMTEAEANQSAMSGGTGESDYMGYCMSCHGLEGKGDGPLAESLGENIVPADLSDAELISSRSDERLFNTIKNGGKSVGLSDSMPDWGYNFTDDAIRSLVQYIRSDLCKCKAAAD